MKLQDKYPYDKTILGLNRIFYTIGDKSSFFSSPCVLSTSHIITTGRTYLLVNPASEKSGVKMYEVMLLDGYYKDCNVYLIVRDMISQKKYIIKFCLDCTLTDCKYMLIDFNFFFDRMNAKAVKSYCGKCDDTKKKSVAESKSKLCNDELLDFEY